MDAAEVFCARAIGSSKGGSVTALLWDIASLCLALAALIGSAALLGAAIALMIGVKRSLRRTAAREPIKTTGSERAKIVAAVLSELKKQSGAGRPIATSNGMAN